MKKAVILLLALVASTFAALTGTDRGTGSNNSSSTTTTLSPASNFSAGSIAVLVISADNSVGGGATENFTSVTDTLGNTWIEQNTLVYDPGTTNAGVQGAFYTTNQGGGTLQTSTTITITFADATQVEAWTLIEVAPSAGNTVSVVNSGDGTGSATTTPTVTTGSITNTNMVIGGLFNEQGSAQVVTGDLDTTNGTWSIQQTTGIGSGASGQTISSQYKVVTATATQTFNPTLLTSSDVILGWIELQEVAAPVTGGKFLPFF